MENPASRRWVDRVWCWIRTAVLEEGVRRRRELRRAAVRFGLSAVLTAAALWVQLGSPVRAQEGPDVSHRVDVRFGPDILLLGYDLEPEAALQAEPPTFLEWHFNAHADLMPEHNTRVRVVYYWQCLGEMTVDYEVRAALEKAYGEEYVVDHTHQPVNGVYPTSMWRRGEVVREEFLLDIPAALPPLRYALRVGVVDPQRGDALTAEGDVPVEGGWKATLGYLDLMPREPPVGLDEAPPMRERLVEDVGDNLVLQGYELAFPGGGEGMLRAGETLEIGTAWLCRGQVPDDVPVWAELRNGDIGVRTLLGIDPTRLWEAGRFYVRRGELALSPNLLAGRYDLRLVIGATDAREVDLGVVEVAWAHEPLWVLAQAGAADGEKGDVPPLDTDRTLEMEFWLDAPRGLEVVAGWTGDAFVRETRVEVWVGNRYSERYLTTWVVPRGRYSTRTVTIPAALTAGGRNTVSLRVPEYHGKPRYLGWRAWVDAAFPDLLYGSYEPWDGWVWADFVRVSAGPLPADWRAYRDLAQAYAQFEMYDEVASLLDRALGAGLRPQTVAELDVFADAFDKAGAAAEGQQVQDLARALIAHKREVRFADRVEFLGYSLERTEDAEGRLHLFFRALRPLDADFTVWLHQYERDVEGFTPLDHLLRTSRWRPGRIYEDVKDFRSAGEEVRFIFGLWQGTEDTRLEIGGTPGAHQVDLGWIGLDDGEDAR